MPMPKQDLSSICDTITKLTKVAKERNLSIITYQQPTPHVVTHSYYANRNGDQFTQNALDRLRRQNTDRIAPIRISPIYIPAINSNPRVSSSLEEFQGIGRVRRRVHQKFYAIVINTVSPSKTHCTAPPKIFVI
jgi:hypothetical protein